MLHEETVEEGTLALIRRLTADKLLKDFVLVGGTALSLQLGHRKSIDIDLFIAHPFDVHAIARHIESTYRPTEMHVLGNTIFSRVAGIKLDMMAHGYPWLKPIQETDGVRMASIEDIAAMKLNAIVGNGSRLKDYVDIHYLLEIKSLIELTEAYVAKYPDTNKSIARNALLYHSEIKFGVDPKLLHREFNWKDMVQRFKAAVVEPKRIFAFKQGPAMDIPKTDEKDVLPHIKKGRRR
jgi:hypothetical protein